MIADKKRFSISLDDELVAAVEKYQHDNELRHRSDALLELATAGLHKMQAELGIKNYHDLDSHGKRIVDLVIKEEFRRMEKEQELQNVVPKDSLLKITYFNEIPASAGTGMPMYNDREYSITIEVPDTDITRRADFAIRVSGDSMEPDYQDEDIVLVRKDNVYEGDVGVFIINGDSYIKELGHESLISKNKNYDDIPLHDFDSTTIVGKVIGKL